VYTPAAAWWGITPWSWLEPVRKVVAGAARQSHREEDNWMWDRIKTVLAGALIVFGIAAFTYQGLTYATRGRDIDRIPAPPSIGRASGIPPLPILGAILLVAGIALLLMDTKDFTRAASSKRAQPEKGLR
jgi:hypothetical protein